jgi:tetratricopeptide (TPR) repeat protein
MQRIVAGVAVGSLGLMAVFGAAKAWAAATLKGQVVLNRERGEPVASVAVSADGANQTITQTDGRFVLVFPSRQPGQDTRVIVAHPGWIVVNDLLLQHRLPDNPEFRPLEIIICRGAEREQWALEFYRLKGTQAVDQQYQRRLAELEGRQAAKAQERERLLRERDQALRQAEDLARQLALRPVAVAGGGYPEALRLFLDGDLEAALKRLSEDRLRREAADAQEKLDETGHGWRLRGKLLALRFDVAGAARAYGEAVKLAPSSWQAWFEYGQFHQHQNRYRDARRGYEQALRLARTAGDMGHIARTLNSLGVLHSGENRLDAARQAYEEARGLYRTLAQKNPDVYLPDVAMILNNLGVLHRNENRMVAARRAYEEALGLYRMLAQKNPDAYLSYVATILNNLGVLHRNANRLVTARQAYEEALEIRRTLAQKNPDVYLSSVATTLNNLGNLHRTEKRLGTAREAYEEALGIYRALAEKNSDA